MQMSHRKLTLIVAVVFLATTLLFARTPKAYAWDASTQITSVVESGYTVLIIQFALPSYFGIPTPSHYPFEYQIRTTENDEQYLEYPPVSIQQPTTAVFTVRYNFSACIRYIFYVQARLHDNQAGWSTWQPESMGMPVPEFPVGVPLVALSAVAASFYLLRKRRMT
jgi:hypothetical protein